MDGKISREAATRNDYMGGRRRANYNRKPTRRNPIIVIRTTTYVINRQKDK